MKKLITLIALLLTCLPSSAYYHLLRNYTKYSTGGGPQNWDILQAPSGFMYFANSNGLLEYDGSDFYLYPSPNGTTIKSLAFDGERNVFVGATGEFGYYTATDSDSHLTYTSLTRIFDSVGGVSEIVDIHFSNKYIYIQDRSSIYQYIFGEDDVTRLNISGVIDCSAVINGDILAAVRNEGLYLCSHGYNTVLPGNDLIKNSKIISIQPFKNITLIVTERDGIFQYDGIEIRQVKRFGLDLDDIITCCATYGNYIALGTINHGVFIFDTKDGANFHQNIDTGLQNNTVRSLHFGSTGNLWLGLDKGITYLRLNSIEQHIFGMRNSYGSGFASVKKDNTLYLGTSLGLYSIDDPEGNIDKWQYDVKKVEGIEEQIWHLNVIDNDLICSHENGIYIISDSDRIYPVQGIDNSLRVIPLLRNKGYAIGVSNTGFFILAKSSDGIWYHYSDLGNVSLPSKMFEEDALGRIIIASKQRGLTRITLSSDLMRAVNIEEINEIMGFPDDKDIVLSRLSSGLVFSTKDGFYRIGDEQAEKDDVLNGYFKGTPRNLHIWESNGGLMLFYNSDHKTVVYPEGKGFVTDSTSLVYLTRYSIAGYEHVGIISDNVAVVNSETGFSALMLDQLINSDNRHSQRNNLFFKQISSLIDGQEHPIFGSRIHHPEGYEELDLPYKYNNLKIVMACAEYDNDRPLLYSFRLEGHENEYSAPIMNKTRSYYNLSPGNYVLYARVSDGLDETFTEVSIPITIQSPWYASLGAILVYCIVVMGIALVLINEYDKRKKQSLKEIQAKKEKEANEAKVASLEKNAQEKAELIKQEVSRKQKYNELLISLQKGVDTLEYFMSQRNDCPPEAKQLIKDMKEGISKNFENEDWNNFKAEFESIHNNFLTKLESEYPKLTDNDKKICVYLQLGKSSKEIASLIGTTERSIEMSRYRMRQKLGLSKEDNLVDWLINFSKKTEENNG